MRKRRCGSWHRRGKPEEGEQRRLHEPRHPVDDPVAERQHDDRERLPLTGPIVVPVFYTEIFDWKVSKAEGMDYWLVSTVASGRQGPTEPGGINGGITRCPMAGGVKQVNYVTVGSVEETVHQAERLGASVLKGKTAIPSMGWFAILADPEKNVFGIFQNDSGAR